MSEKIKRSPLDENHRQLGARMLPFAGWEMPIQYTGIVAEHNAVRESVGAFDISHMGQITITGNDACDWLNGLLTNDVSTLEIGGGQYTLMLNPDGGVIDDLILYRTDATGFFLVVNASKIDEDLAWLRQNHQPGVAIDDVSEWYGAIAIQGPNSAAAWKNVAGHLGQLPPRNGYARLSGEGETVIVCRTGYTGEDGFEFFASPETIGVWWEKFLHQGNAVPCGLGARDSLRLEKCYPLNGADLNAKHTPLEAGLGFFVKLDKSTDFIGHEKLRQQKADGLAQKLVALAIVGKAPPPRHGYDVIDPDTDTKLGELSSGGLSPTLKRGIGLAYLPGEFSKIGTELAIDVRGKKFPCEIVRKPFV